MELQQNRSLISGVHSGNDRIISHIPPRRGKSSSQLPLSEICDRSQEGIIKRMDHLSLTHLHRIKVKADPSFRQGLGYKIFKLSSTATCFFRNEVLVPGFKPVDRQRFYVLDGMEP